MTEDEIRTVVNNLAEAIALLSTASPEDRRRVYEAAQLEVLYDHQNNRAQLSVAPMVIGGVGGGITNLDHHRTPSHWMGLAAA